MWYGDRAALATALERLDGGSPTPTEQDLRTRAVGGLYLLPHGFGGPADEGTGVETRSHPPTGDRIDRLRAFVRELEEA